jgi:choline dehydrogenase-like flavoprotein
MTPRAVVIGAGIAGCVAASRLAGAFEVVVLEAGPDVRAGHRPDGPPAAGAPTWAMRSALTADRSWTASPGRAVGGSSVVNGGYFAAPVRQDLDRWRAAGGPAWDAHRVFTAIESCAERWGARPAQQTDLLARAFAEAAEQAGRSGDLLALRTTVSDGVPRNVAEAFLTDAGAAVQVRSGSRALRIIVEDGRATGVEVAEADGSRDVLPADEIVVCAGAFGTARLLLASGIGPAAALRRAGIEVVADLPGVGASFSDHPTVWVEWMPTPGFADRARSDDPVDGAFPLALSVGADGGSGDDLEILACLSPPNPTAPPVEAAFGLLVGLQRPTARGSVSPVSSHPLAPLRIEYSYLEHPHDRSALRAGVRMAAELLVSAPFAPLVDRLADLDAETLEDDALLDAWIARRLGSAAHACGTAPMGGPDDPLAVVDGAGRVRGIAGLRIADTSILPVVPVRGPASAALATGAVIAEQLVARV